MLIRAKSAGRILLAEDDPAIRRLLDYLLTADGYQLRQANDGIEALELLKDEPFDLILTDLYMPNMDGMELLKKVKELEPDLPVLMLTAHSSIKSAITAIRLGAYDYLEKPVDHDRLRAVVKNVLEHRRLRLKARLLDSPGSQTWQGMIGRSNQMRWTYQTVERIARYRTPILITGESGTGKEMIARAIHNLSPRSRGPMVAVNSAGIVDGLFESLMFGHIRGSFTGANRDQKGYFETASGGTLFLDEVGELSMSGQARLLRVLETQEILPVGAPRPRQVDVRIVSATNRDLLRAVEDGSFRRDLYFRLCGVDIELPPLRDRGEDLQLLANSFLDGVRQEAELDVIGFSPKVLELFSQYSWPGNIRELRQVVESAAVISREKWIQLVDLPPRLNASAVGERTTAPEPPPLPESLSEQPGPSEHLPSGLQLKTLRECESEHVKAVLKACQANRTQTARVLGISRHALYRLLRKHELE